MDPIDDVVRSVSDEHTVAVAAGMLMQRHHTSYGDALTVLLAAAVRDDVDLVTAARKTATPAQPGN